MHARAWHSASRVENRMALALPVLRTDRFCTEIPTLAESSVSFILRLASCTSKLTMIGIASPSDCEFEVSLHLTAFFHELPILVGQIGQDECGEAEGLGEQQKAQVDQSELPT